MSTLEKSNHMIHYPQYSFDQEPSAVHEEKREALIAKRDQIIGDLPEDAVDEIVLSELAEKILKNVTACLGEDLSHPDELFSSRLVRDDLEIVKKLMEQQTIHKVIIERFPVEEFFEQSELDEKEIVAATENLKQVCSLYVSIYLLHVLEDLESLLLEKEQLEREFLNDDEAQENDFSCFTDPRQQKLFQEDL